MPKIIDCSREALLEETRKILLEEGVSAFSIRELARRCGVSSGTIYNFFPSRAELFVNAIIGDWLQVLDRLKQRKAEFGADMAALRALYEAVCRFQRDYASILLQISSPQESAAHYRRGYHLLQQQVANTIRDLTSLSDPELRLFLANLFLVFSRDEAYPFDRISPYLARLLP